MTPEQELEAFRDWPETEVCKLLASRIRRMRQAIGESQSVFATRAHVPLRTYKRFEVGGKATLETFLRVMRTLDRTQYLHLLFPSAPAKFSPSLGEKIAQARARGLQSPNQD